MHVGNTIGFFEHFNLEARQNTKLFIECLKLQILLFFHLIDILIFQENVIHLVNSFLIVEKWPITHNNYLHSPHRLTRPSFGARIFILS